MFGVRSCVCALEWPTNCPQKEQETHKTNILSTIKKYVARYFLAKFLPDPKYLAYRQSSGIVVVMAATRRRGKSSHTGKSNKYRIVGFKTQTAQSRLNIDIY